MSGCLLDTSQYDARILAVSPGVADRWGRFDPTRPVPPVDGLLAATALEHDLVLVTRNEAHITATGAKWLNPFIAVDVRRL